MARQVAIALTLALLGLGGFVGFFEWRYQRLSRALDADVGTLRRLHWERPVLRGTPGDGNAALEMFGALADFRGVPSELRGALADSVYYGRTADTATLALLREHAETLDRLRAATQLRFAHSELVPERGKDMRVPEYEKVVDAALLLLARAHGSAADECLRIAADVIRLGQDLVPGAALEAASVSMRLTSLAAPVLVRCATKADPPTLRRTAHELNSLATHAPPTGAALELQDIVTAAKLRARATLTNKPGTLAVIEAIQERPAVIEAWARYTDPTRLRQLVPARYPDALDEWKSEQDARARARLPFVSSDAQGVVDFLYDDMRGQALLRALTVGVATLADRAYRGKLPSEATTAREAALCDPFTGKPLGYRVAADGSELVVWSVGEDMHDGRGSEEWHDAAPMDVTVRFPILTPKPDEPRAKRGG
jgi:hypothetical protein